MKKLVAALFFIVLFSGYTHVTHGSDHPGNPFEGRELGNPFGDRRLGDPFEGRELGNPFGGRRLGDPFAHKHVSSPRSPSPSGHKNLGTGNDVTYNQESKLTWDDGHNDAVSVRSPKSSAGSYAVGYQAGLARGSEVQQGIVQPPDIAQPPTIIHGEWDTQGRHYTPAGGGNIWRSDGTFMPKAAGGYIDTKTGLFVPAN